MEEKPASRAVIAGFRMIDSRSVWSRGSYHDVALLRKAFKLPGSLALQGRVQSQSCTA